MKLSLSLFRQLQLGLCVSYLISACDSPSNTVTLTYDTTVAQANFAATKLVEQLENSGFQLASDGGQYQIKIQGVQDEITDEGYTLSVSGTGIEIKGNDLNGMLYGTLDLTGQLRQHGSLDSINGRQEQARFPFRAIKYNLPWDSYRRSEALQLHMETCRDLSYWAEFLDIMV